MSERSTAASGRVNIISLCAIIASVIVSIVISAAASNSERYHRNTAAVQGGTVVYDDIQAQVDNAEISEDEEKINQEAAEIFVAQDPSEEEAAQKDYKPLDDLFKYESKVDCIEYMLYESPNYIETTRIDVKGLMIHSIGATQPSAIHQANVYADKNYNRAGVHAFIDANTGDVYHTLPWSQEGWHAGELVAPTHIGVEMCETEAGEYTSDFRLVISDKTKALEQTRIAYESAVKLFAQLCIKFDLNPREDIISHKEGALSGIATRHGDPDEYWEYVGCGYTMDGFRNDVYNYIHTKMPEYTLYYGLRQMEKAFNLD